MKYYGVNLRDDRTIPNIVKVVRNVVNHRHPKLPELLAGGHPQGLPLGQTWKVFTNSEEISFGTLVWDFAFSNSGWSPPRLSRVQQLSEEIDRYWRDGLQRSFDHGKALWEWLDLDLA